MSRPVRIILKTAAVLAGLFAVAAIALLIVVQTAWFRNYLRTKIIAYAEEATGGKVEIHSFGFEWTTRHVSVEGFVLHGTEPPGSPPLFSARKIDVNLKLLPSLSLSHLIELDYLGVDQPRVNVIVYPDGHTNVPAPKAQPGPGNTTVLEDFVNLAIHKFDIQNGTLMFAQFPRPNTNEGSANRSALPPGDRETAEEKYEFSARGENLRTQLSYNLLPGTYDGQIAMSPLRLQRAGRPPVDLNVTLPLHLERDKIQLTEARIATPDSQITLTGEMDRMLQPHTSAHLTASISLDEAKRLVGSALPITVPRNGPGLLKADITLSIDKDHIETGNSRITLGNSNIEASGALKDPSGNTALQFKASLVLDELGRMFKGGLPRGTVALDGNARLAGTKLDVNGRLADFEIAGLLQNRHLGYSGVISGPIQATVDVKSPSSLRANVHLAIAPGRRGVPVSGRLNADYNGATDSIDIAKSYIALPNTRLDLSGSAGRQVHLQLVSHNFNDFDPLTKLPIALQSGGAATFTGDLTGKLSAPQLAGHVSIANFRAQDRQFNSLVADLNVSPSSASVQNGALTRGALQARFTATVGLTNWSATSNAPLTANATIANADLADVLALAGGDSKDFRGTLNASAQIGGSIGNPRGGATLTIANLTAYQEHFDQLAGHVNFADRLIDIPDMQLTAGQNRIDLTAAYEHPANSLETGRLNVKVTSNNMSLAQFEAVKKGTPQLTGMLQFTGDATAKVEQVNKETQFLVTGLNANATAHGMQYEGNNYGDFTATAQTSGNIASFNINSDFAGSTIHATGQTRLIRDYPTTANLNVNNLHVERVLTIAGRQDIPFTGVLSTTAQLSGTLNDPHANADLRLSNATYYEHFDLIQGHIDYSKQSIGIPSLQVTSGPGHAQLTASFVPLKPGEFASGKLAFKLDANQFQLAQFRELQKQRPGIAGLVEIKAEGVATLQNEPGKPPILFSNLNANASATGLSMNKKPYGDAKLTATTSGSDLVFNLDSNFAGSRIRGDGRATLSGDYPIAANVTFANVHYANLRDWFGAADPLPNTDFDALVEGSATVSGPFNKPENLKASVRLPKLEMTAKPRGVTAAKQNPILLHNQGPVVATLDRSSIHIDSAHIVGPETDIKVTGGVTFEPKQDLNLNVNATTNLNLSLFQNFDRDVFSSGVVIVQAAIRGPLDDLSMNGRVQLQNASFNTINATNGISNANGVILLSGKTATIQSLTGESGGGTVSATGSTTFGGGTMKFQLAATGRRIRVRYPEGASTVFNADVRLNGTTDNSTLVGNVAIQRIAFNPRSDFGSMLSNAATPIQTPATPSPLLSNMHLQMRIQTAADAEFQTSLAQNVELVANLRVSGTAATPGVVGRINITEGKLIFFGAEYTVSQGLISFYDPLRIAPVLNINLETVVQGVNVILNVAGPSDNMTLTHRSDPPLPFNEVMALLATGKAPASDPTIAAHMAPAQPQSVQQMGESALLSQTIANPLASRLQRVFGVSQIKIAPAFVGGSSAPQARMTLQQQVTRNVTFTYITDLTNSNEQVVQVEWALNPTWSAVATRDENGIFSVDFYYKRKIK